MFVILWHLTLGELEIIFSPIDTPSSGSPHRKDDLIDLQNRFDSSLFIHYCLIHYC